MTVTCVRHHAHVGDTSMYNSDNTFTMYNLIFKTIQGVVCGYPLQLLEISLIVKSAFEIK